MTKKFVTLGEVMLRLKAPTFERFFQSPSFEATFGGGEGNVALSLSNFGLDAAFISAIPAIASALTRSGMPVCVSCVVMGWIHNSSSAKVRVSVSTS